MAGSLKWFKCRNGNTDQSIAVKLDESNGELAGLGFEDYNTGMNLPIGKASDLAWITVSNSVAGKRRLPVGSAAVQENADLQFATTVFMLPVDQGNGTVSLLPFKFDGSKGKSTGSFAGKKFAIGNDTGLLDGDAT